MNEIELYRKIHISDDDSSVHVGRYNDNTRFAVVISMSRWSRRSQEEKEQLHEEQKTKKVGQNTRQRAIEGDFLGVASRMNDMMDDTDKWTKVVNAGDLPIFCPYDGWVGCKTYELKNKSLPGASEYLVAEGNCRICQRPISKSINAHDGNAIITMQLISQLKREGRLTDTRKVKD